MGENTRFEYLLKQYLDENLTERELDEFFDFVDSGKVDDLLSENILMDLKEEFSDRNSAVPVEIFEKIKKRIAASEGEEALVVPIRQRSYKKYWAAAAAIILLIVSVYLIRFVTVTPDTQQTAVISHSNGRTTNDLSDKARIIELTDGSIVTLNAGASIRTSESYGKFAREVYLTGDASFEVAHDAKRPFFVYYGNIVTRVLGTSFKVTTNKTNGKIEVSVTSGRVHVYENTGSASSNDSLNGVTLTRNQKVVYEPDGGILFASLVESPVALDVSRKKTSLPDQISTLVFDGERVENIINELRNLYGIDIIIENSALNDCVFTGDLSGQGLFTQLDIICLATNSSFAINGTRIIISGKGCRYK